MYIRVGAFICISEKTKKGGAALAGEEREKCINETSKIYGRRKIGFRNKEIDHDKE